MVKKRLIFTLLYNDGMYCLSRNFKLQKVGDLQWIIDNYEFDRIADAIDELIILNVSEDKRYDDKFRTSVMKLSSYCFIPLSIGGGIRSVDDAYAALDFGADKIVVNSLLANDQDVVREIVSIFGSQFVVGSIDYRKSERGQTVYIGDGKVNTEIGLLEYISKVKSLGVGELYVNSIDKDGTGQGFDVDLLDAVSKSCTTPVIAAGGAGKPEHFYDVLKRDNISAGATANLFNFMADGFIDVRNYLKSERINLANFG